MVKSKMKTNIYIKKKKIKMNWKNEIYYIYVHIKEYFNMKGWMLDFYDMACVKLIYIMNLGCNINVD